MNRPPFRTHLQVPDPATPLPPGYLCLEEELQDLEREPSPPRPERVRRWLLHPDERVARALLERCWELRRMGQQEGWVLKILREREDHAPGEWTPLLDRLSSNAPLPSQYERRLAQFCRQARAEEVLPLQAFRHPMPSGVAARSCQHWTPALVQALGEGVSLEGSRSPQNLIRMGKNPHLRDPESAEALFRLCVENFQSAWSLPAARFPGSALAHLFRRQVPLPTGAVEELLDLISRWQGREGKRPQPALVAPLAGALGHRPGLTPSEAARVLAAAGRRPEVVAALVEAPHTPLATLKRALRESPQLVVRRAVAKREEALGDPEIRLELEKSNCANIRTALIRTAPPEEALRHLRHLGQTNQSRALQVMEEELPEGVPIPAETAAAILSDSWAGMRERMFRVLAQRPLAPPPAADEGPAPEVSARPAPPKRGR